MQILFLCTGNSCRSQMAEALWRHEQPGDVALSAGSSPKPIHPLTYQVLAEINVPTSGLRSKSLSEIDLDEIDVLITVCGKADDSCPVLPAHIDHQHWPFPDPAEAEGPDPEKMVIFRETRDAIWARIREYMNQ